MSPSRSRQPRTLIRLSTECVVKPLSLLLPQCLCLSRVTVTMLSSRGCSALGRGTREGCGPSTSSHRSLSPPLLGRDLGRAP